MPAFAQADPVAALPGSTVERLTEDIRTLAADAFEGRGVETEGIELAAEYVRAQMETAGLTPAAADGSYFQPFDIRPRPPGRRGRTVLADPHRPGRRQRGR